MNEITTREQMGVATRGADGKVTITPTGNVKLVTKSESEIGDPRFITELSKLLKQYTDLFGLAAAQQLDLTSGGSALTVPAKVIIEYIHPDPETE